MFFWNIQQLLNLLFLQKEVSETTFCRKNNFNKVSRSFKNNFLQKKQFYKVSRSFKNNFDQAKQLKETFENNSSNLPASAANNKITIKQVLVESMYALTNLWTQ